MRLHHGLAVVVLLATAACSTNPALAPRDTTSLQPGAPSALAGAITSNIPGSTFTAVIDASSSKTRLYLYSVDSSAPYPLIVNLKEVEFKRTASGADEDGINNFVDPTNPELERTVMPETITPLLNNLTATLASLGVSPADVEVNVLATAGMRGEQERWKDLYPNAVSDFYALIKDGITTAGYRAGQVRTTDGNSEEGLWSWVALNDRLVEAFTSSRPPVGVVEVGGSSAQISYPTSSPAGSPNVYDVTLNGHSYRVFNRTFLGLGVDDARKQMRQGSAAPAACFPVGFPAAQDSGETEPGYPLITTAGAYDQKACSAAFATIVGATLAKYGDPQVASSTGSFVGTDATLYATDYFAVQDRPGELAAATQKACGAAEADLATNFPAIATNQNVQRQCATSTYINTLLYDPAVGLFRANPAAFTRAVTSKGPSGSSEITWTRGFLLLRYGRPAA